MKSSNFEFLAKHTALRNILVSIILLLFLQSSWLFAIPKSSVFAALHFMLGLTSSDTIQLSAPSSYKPCEDNGNFIPSDFLNSIGVCKPGDYLEKTQDYKHPPEYSDLPRKIYTKDASKIDSSIGYHLITNPDSSSNGKIIDLFYNYGYKIKVQVINGTTPSKERRRIQRENKNRQYLGKFIPVPEQKAPDALSAWFNSWKSEEYQPEILPKKIESCSLQDLLLRPKHVHKLGGERQSPWNINQAVGNCSPSIYGKANYFLSGRDKKCEVSKKGNVVELYIKGKEVNAVVLTDAVATAAQCKVPQRTAKHKKRKRR
jgi:hypothetical protein